MNRDQSCGSCQFWYQSGDGGAEVGECRRNPPQLIVAHIGQKVANPANPLDVRIIQREQIQAGFPSMLSDDIGCGEYRETE